MSEVTVGRFVHALTEAKWIRRKPDPNDGRSMLLSPTRKATDAVPKFLRVVNTLMDGAFKSFTPAEIEQFLGSWEKLANNLDDEWQVKRRYGKQRDG